MWRDTFDADDERDDADCKDANDGGASDDVVDDDGGCGGNDDANDEGSFEANFKDSLSDGCFELFLEEDVCRLRTPCIVTSAFEKEDSFENWSLFESSSDPSVRDEEEGGASEGITFCLAPL